MIHGDVSSDLIRTIFAPRTAAPRWRGHHPRRDDPRRRRPAAAGRDDGPRRAVRDPPPGGARHRRADRRDRRRRVRGERPDQPRRTVAHRPQPQRGAARQGDPQLLDPSHGRAPRGLGLAIRQRETARHRHRPHGPRGDPSHRASSSTTGPSSSRRSAWRRLLYGGLVLSQSSGHASRSIVPVDAREPAAQHLPADDRRAGAPRSATSRRPASSRSPSTFVRPST